MALYGTVPPFHPEIPLEDSPCLVCQGRCDDEIPNLMDQVKAGDSTNKNTRWFRPSYKWVIIPLTRDISPKKNIVVELINKLS